MPADPNHPIETVAALLADAFNDLATASYLVPDPVERRRAVEGQFAILADHARTAGGIETAGTSQTVTGVVVWFDHTGPVPEIPDYQARMRAVYGAHFDRFAALEAAMDRHHPAEGHHHIALVGTHPELQGTGIATELLTRTSHRLDQSGTPGYLEAVSEPTARFYERFGFEPRGEPFPIGPDGPLLYPMWRTVRTGPGAT